MTEIITSKQLTQEQFVQINELWNDEYPINLKDRFPLLLDGVENYNHYIIEDTKHNVIAWAVYFEKENQIRFSIIVSSCYQEKGFGSLLIEKLKQANDEFYGWLIDHNNDRKNNGKQYKTPLLFYLKHGFEVISNTRIDSEKIKAVLIKWNKKSNLK